MKKKGYSYIRERVTYLYKGLDFKLKQAVTTDDELLEQRDHFTFGELRPSFKSHPDGVTTS